MGIDVPEANGSPVGDGHRESPAVRSTAPVDRRKGCWPWATPHTLTRPRGSSLDPPPSSDSSWVVVPVRHRLVNDRLEWQPVELAREQAEKRDDFLSMVEVHVEAAVRRGISVSGVRALRE